MWPIVLGCLHDVRVKWIVARNGWVVDWSHLAQNTAQWRVLSRTVIASGILQNPEYRVIKVRLWFSDSNIRKCIKHKHTVRVPWDTSGQTQSESVVRYKWTDTQWECREIQVDRHRARVSWDTSGQTQSESVVRYKWTDTEWECREIQVRWHDKYVCCV
jgi:hypothetical protein